MKTILMACAALGALTISSNALAQDDHSHHDHAHHLHASHNSHDHQHASNVPAAIMGDHVHGKGEWMLGYSFMQMNMRDNRDGTNGLSPRDISGDFANTSGVGPATMRIVPTEMTTDMHMFSAMYGVTDRITVMGMAHYIDRDMDHVTFAGGNPDLEIGRFNTRTQGWGDTKLAGLYAITPEITGKIGLSIPTGSIKERDTILNPMGMQQEVRLPYAMQLGSGTYDFEPAITYARHQDAFSWGGQYSGQIRLGRNNQGYTLGDKHKLSAWGGYQWNEYFGSTLRVTGEHEGQIDGRDTDIAGPVQTTDPDNYGGKRVELGLGFNITPLKDKGHTIAVEASAPVYQNLNGPQLERHYGFTARYRYSF